MLTDEERRTLIHMALGKASLGFMTQPEGANVVMPTEHLLDVANDIDEVWSKDIATLRAAVEERDRAIVSLARGDVYYLTVENEVWALRGPGDVLAYKCDGTGTDADLIRVVLAASKGGE